MLSAGPCHQTADITEQDMTVPGGSAPSPGREQPACQEVFSCPSPAFPRLLPQPRALLRSPQGCPRQWAQLVFEAPYTLPKQPFFAISLTKVLEEEPVSPPLRLPQPGSVLLFSLNHVMSCQDPVFSLTDHPLSSPSPLDAGTRCPVYFAQPRPQ